MELTSSRLMQLCKKTGFIKWYFQGAFFYGSVLAARGDQNGLNMMREAIDRFEQSEELVELSIFYGLMADRYLMHDEFAEANNWVDKGLNLVETYGERFVEAPLLRLKARCLTETEPESESVPLIDELLAQANNVANAQQAIIWQKNQMSMQFNDDVCAIDSRFP
jgi:hypothetical protein